MSAPTQLRATHRRLLSILVAATLLAGCAAGQMHAQGERQFKDGHPEEGLASLREAARLDPGNLEYRLHYQRRLQEEVNRLEARATELREKGDFSRAKTAYQTAAQLDPTNERVRRGLEQVETDSRHATELADASSLFEADKPDAARDLVRSVLHETPSDASAKILLAKIDAAAERRRQSREAKLDAQSVLRRPVTLQFRDANLRMVFEALSRTTGLNAVFDRDVRPDLKTTIFVRDGSVADTVDLILLQNQLEKKILNANTIFIYSATAEKQKEYQDLKVRTFRVSNADPKYILGMLKSVLKLKEGQVDERTGTLVLRDTPETLDVAAKLIAAHDFPDAEVMLEVEVLEVSRDRLTDLGVKWPDNIAVSTPLNANGALTVGGLRGLRVNDLLVTPLQMGLNLKLQDTDANLLASPRIRVRDREKAKILIGDRVPVITNSVTPMATGTAVVTGSIQYLDVGIKLEAEPRVYDEGEVGIKLNLEVSNIVKEVAGSGGSLAYQIGTRSASTSLRLRDGETQVLGGLISDSDRRTAAKVPGLGQMPVLGRLFSNTDGDHAKSEIVLSITPRIVRAKGMAEESMTETWSGTESAVRDKPLRLDPIASVSGGVGNATSAASASMPPAPVLLPVPAAAHAADAAGGTAIPKVGNGPAAADKLSLAAPAPVPAQNALQVVPVAPADTHATQAAQAAVSQARLSLVGANSVRKGNAFTVSVRADEFNNVNSVPIAIQYDPAVLSFVGANPGALAVQSEAPKADPEVNPTAGRLNLALHSGKNKSFSGSGELLNLTFTAKLARSATQLALAPAVLDEGEKAQRVGRPSPLTIKVEQ